MIKANLPFEPGVPWWDFVETYENLPTTATKDGAFKSVEAHSSYLPGGVTVSSTITPIHEIGRIVIDAQDKKYVRPDLISAIVGWGWEYLLRGKTQIVFRKTLPLKDGASTIARAFPLVLEKLGVESNQDWGNK
jgi:hypothetical protein